MVVAAPASIHAVRNDTLIVGKAITGLSAFV